MFKQRLNIKSIEYRIEKNVLRQFGRIKITNGRRIMRKERKNRKKFQEEVRKAVERREEIFRT